MKIPQVLISICLALAACGCHRHSADAVPPGSFRLIVEDTANDETFRIASLKVSSLQSGRISVGMANGRANGELLISATDKLREGIVMFIASRVTDSRTTNAYIAARLQVKVEGGDGGMLIYGTFQSSCDGIYYASKDNKLADTASLTAKDGIYPLDTPLAIGRIDGKPVTLTVGNQPL